MKLNICEQEVLLHKQQKYKHRLYKMGDVTAIIDFGNKKNHQEDSLLVSNHKQFPSNQLLLVADGVGGEPNGNLASNIAAIEVFQWFQNLEKDTLNNSTNFKNNLHKFIFELHDNVGKKSHWGCTTLVVAIINKEEIFIFNIGDSRAYIYDDTLKQITKDHSYVQMLYDTGMICDIEDMRFHKLSNVINSSLGGVASEIDYNFYELDKSNINQLFLCSDGVSDCISHEEFAGIAMLSNTACEDIVKNILTYDSFRTKEKNISHYNDKIPAGKDNISLIHKQLTKTR